MSQDSSSSSSAGAAGSSALSEQDEEVVTIGEYLAEYDQLTETAQAVLGNVDDETCTYGMGYMNRQPLYSCLTCAEKFRTGPAGFCLGCSLHCHEGHECVELYTKRNFRCDCGNSKFGEIFKCKLNPAKDPLNESNRYNQNFKGLYCTCHRPYPDPDDDQTEDEMVQCIVCEDWLHTGHACIPEDREFEELVCSDCTEKLPFLIPYAIDDKFNETKAKDDTPPNGETAETIVCTKPVAKISRNDESSLSSGTGITTTKGPLFFQLHWRNRLCKCESCMAMYKEKDCLYLLDGDDTLFVYEEKAKANKQRKTLEDRNPYVKAWDKMDRVQKVEMIHGYNTMTTELAGFLNKFAAAGKVVRDKDIYDFFDELRSRKRMRMNDDDYENLNTKNFDF